MCFYLQRLSEKTHLIYVDVILSGAGILINFVDVMRPAYKNAELVTSFYCKVGIVAIQNRYYNNAIES